MDKFCLLVAIPSLRAPAKFDRFSVWFLNPGGAYTRCAWAGGTFFPVVLLCQSLVLAGNRFWFYLICTYVLRVQYSCGDVFVFWFWREIVFGVTYVLCLQYSCTVVSVFWLWREIVP